jgi:ubiquinone/menaquinone biosynthesis C-methylase UbiE
VVQKGISFLPASHKINYLFQKYVTKGVILSDEYFFDRLGHGAFHAKAFTRFRNRLPHSTLELGTGWYPVVPVAMFLFGADHIVTIDITPLCDKGKLITTINKMIDAIAKNQVDPVFLQNKERIGELKKLAADAPSMSMDEILEKLRITYLETDARKLPYPDQTFDLVHSNNTYEHIYEPILKGIIREFKRIQKKDGLQSHFIDMSDHFAHADTSITIYNYLQYTEAKWLRMDNSVQPQNRMRINQYRALYKLEGLHILQEELRPGDAKALESVKLEEPFRSFSKEDVLPSHGYVVSE